MKLDFFTAIGQVKQATGVWLIHGDEPLLYQLLLDQFRAYWLKQQIERKRFDVMSASDWREPLSEVSALSLFSDQKVIEVHTSIRPDATQLKALEQLMLQPDEQPFLIVMPKQDGAAQKTNFYKSVEANGKAVNLTLYKELDKKKVLERMAQKQRLHLTPDSWSILLEHNQNNLLAAYQTLLRLTGLFGENEAITPEKIENGLIGQSRYTVFNLVDAMLNGKTESALQMLLYFEQTEESPLAILPVISKEINNLLKMKAGTPAAQLQGVWPARMSQLQRASTLFSTHQLESSLELLLKVDQASKGIGPYTPYQLLDDLILLLRIR